MSLFRTSRRRLQRNVQKLKNPNEFSFIFLGDSWAGDGQTSNTIFGLALSAIRSLKRKPLFILHSGDSVFTGTAEEFKTGGTYTDNLPVKSLLQLIQDPTNGVPNIPFFIVPGNHDRTGINGPLTNFRTFIGPTRFSINLPRIKTTIIGLNNVKQLGLDANNQPIYGFSPSELTYLKSKLKKAKKNTLLLMHVPPRIGKWANPNYFKDPESTFGNENGQLTRFLRIIRGKVRHVLVGHVHAFDKLTFQGTRYVISGGAGAPLVKEGFLKGTRTPIFHIIEYTVRNGVVVKRRVIPIGYTA
ncbi:metallophosphoesterase family protein [Bacillus horti]|uniref:metallophosphoesterase family protein n=1 Tax=Caldalkalibacillus horti TaxID=77523 RepID=UPI0027D897FC|nr:metallophosphoesterase [Bacillus horti]